MPDAKSAYSKSSEHFIEITVKERSDLYRKYKQSKARETRFGDQWQKTSVNINEVVDKFAPGTNGRTLGMKYVFEGPEYDVVADMSAGYLRIFKKATNQAVKLDGKPGSRSETHFKILKREEM